MTPEQGYVLIGLVVGFAGGLSWRVLIDLWSDLRALEREEREWDK